MYTVPKRIFHEPICAKVNNDYHDIFINMNIDTYAGVTEGRPSLRFNRYRPVIEYIIEYKLSKSIITGSNALYAI